MSATRVYLGRLPPDVRESEITDHFKGFKLKDIALRGNFGFVEFENALDAEDAIREFDGRDFLGERIIVQPSRENRRPRDDFERPPRGAGGPPRRGVRLHVVGIPDRTSWQDLKDFGRIASPSIMYADVDRNDPTIGVIEFPTLPEAEDAITRLTGQEIRGVPVTLEMAPESAYSSGGGGGGGGSYGGGGGGYGGGRGGYGGGGGGGYGGGGGGGYGGGGGGYGGGRDHDRRPPPPRDYDRRGGDESGGYPPRRDDYRRDEPRRDDYRRDDRPPRRDYDRDRSPPRRDDRERYDDRQDRAPPAESSGRSAY